MVICKSYFDYHNSIYLRKYKVIPINFNESDVDYIFKVNVSYDLKQKKLDIDNIIKYNSNIPSPHYSYFQKDNKFIIQIEYCGKLLNLTKIYQMKNIML